MTDARAAHHAIAARGGRAGPMRTGDDGTGGFADPDGGRFMVGQVAEPK